MWELQEQIEELIQQFFEDSGATPVNAAAIGLDSRAGTVYVSTDERFVAVVGSPRSLEYYGGFEYVDIEYRVVIGDTTFYSDDDSRVAEALEYHSDNQGEV